LNIRKARSNRSALYIKMIKVMPLRMAFFIGQ